MGWRIVWLALAAALWVCGAARASTVVGGKVTITEQSPIQALDGTGQPVGVTMGKAGAVYTLVKVDGDQLILKGGDGTQYEVASIATDYVAPAPGAGANVAAQPPGPASKSAANVVSTPSAAPSGDTAMIAKINQAFGVRLLKDARLFLEPLPDTGSRLNCEAEGDNDLDEYRSYDPRPVLDCKTFSVSVESKDGKAARITVIFTNRNEFRLRSLRSRSVGQPNLSGGIPTIAPSLDTLPSPQSGRDEQKAFEEKFAAEWARQDKEIRQRLTSLFGDPVPTTFGPDKDHDVLRWNWKDIFFLYNNHHGNFISLEIVPSAVADRPDALPAANRSDLSQALLSHVQNKANKDVLITDIPDVKVGWHGGWREDSDSATWERCLHYLGIPGDRFLMNTDGAADSVNTYSDSMALATAYLAAYHCRTKYLDGMSVNLVASYIDQGVPVIWKCFILRPVGDVVDKYSAKHDAQTDWHDYLEQMNADDKKINFGGMNSVTYGNVCYTHLIVGYNRTTNQLAFLDSTPDSQKVRWISEAELGFATYGNFEAVSVDW